MRIETITRSNLHLINTIDSTFTVDSKLKIKLSDNRFSYEIDSLSSYEKTYDNENPDYSEYINNDTGTVFFAFEKERVTGQIIILKYWNGYTYINDIRVEKEFRGKGIGKALIQ